MAPDPYPKAVLDILDAAGDRPVFEHGDRVVTGGDMLGMVRRIAAGLRATGIGPGDGLATLLGVTPEAFAAIVAGHVVGARVVTVRPGLPDAQRKHLLSQDIAAVVRDKELAGLLATPEDGGPLELSGRPHDVARLIHTSGSTGMPKCCAQTYAAMAAAWATRPDVWPPAIREIAACLERYLVFGSLGSQVMMEYAMLTLTAGGTMIAADPLSFPDAFIRYRATASVCTVPRLHKLVAAQRRAPVDLSGVRALMVAGSPLEPARHREALEVLGPVVFHSYGQTETGMISMATPSGQFSGPPGSVGVRPESVDVVVRDPDGHPVPPGVDGELYVRTPAQAVEYWAEPAESAAVFVDGWVRTRDLGRLDHSGQLYLTGRVRDVVIVDANLYYLGPIERLLATHPDVAEAYVLGAPDEDTGEAPHAFVVPMPGRSPDPAALRALVAGHLGRACVPRTVTFVDEVPLAPSGKPDKRLFTT